MTKVGLLGAGFMGSMHAQVYKNLSNARLMAVGDTNISRAEELANKCGATAYGKMQDMLDKEDLDMIDVCLPTFLHKEWVIKAARSGKHILCEKPIALTLGDADEMLQVCNETGVKFMVAHVVRFWPEYVRLKEIFDQKELGNMLSITCTRLSTPPTWGWDNWLIDPNRSGGALLDLHIHDTDFLLHLLGKPLEVFSRMPKSPLGYGHVFTTYTFADRVTAFAEGGWDISGNFPFTATFRASFEIGIVEYNIRNDKTLAIYQQGKEPLYPKVQIEFGEETTASETEGNLLGLAPFFLEIKYFVDCLENNQPPVKAEGNEARESLKVILVERQSAETGRAVKL